MVVDLERGKWLGGAFIPKNDSKSTFGASFSCSFLLCGFSFSFTLCSTGTFSCFPLTLLGKKKHHVIRIGFFQKYTHNYVEEKIVGILFSNSVTKYRGSKYESSNCGHHQMSSN